MRIRHFFITVPIMLLLLNHIGFSQEEEPKQEEQEVEIPPVIEVHKELSEFTLRYGSWSLNLVRKPLEKLVGGILEDNLKNKLIEDIIGDFPGAHLLNYSQEVNFSSGGSTFGFEARWYPRGEGSSFSLGFALEKSTMRIGFPLVSAHMEASSDLLPGQYGTLDAKVENVNLRVEPISFVVVLGWDIFPKWRIHPFFNMALGFFSIRAFEDGRFTVDYQATLVIPAVKTRTWNDKIDKSVRAFIDESTNEDISIPMAVIPVLQLTLGVTGRITDRIALRLEGGFFDGFVIRGGAVLRI